MKLIKKLFRFCVVMALLAGLAVFGTNEYVKYVAKDRILSVEIAATLEDVDCILVLGCGVYDDAPSLMLSDRLERSAELYEAGAAPKLLMSGDHGQQDYDEVAVMKRYAVERGIASEDVFMDHAGFSTYESVYRAKEVFGADKILVVSQAYHLPRALYIAKALGVEAYGVAAEDVTYPGQTLRDLREILARVKDAGYCLIKPEPTFLGETIPISGSGEQTHDGNSDFS